MIKQSKVSGLAEASRRPYSPADRQQALSGWLFSLPFVLVFLVFMIGPLIASFAMSFTDFRATDVRNPFAVNFVGLRTYTDLFRDDRFLQSLKVTGLFALLGIPCAIAAALVLAVALNNGISRCQTLFRVGFYAPVVTSIVAVSVVWRYILQPSGLLNGILLTIGITGPNWLHSTFWALPSVTLLAIWRNVGTLMIIFIAGLQSIPKEIIEASSIDGAGAWRRFFSIKLPILRPTILLGTILISVAFLQFFEESFVMTQGGPLDSTLSISYYTYSKFGQGQYATASAAAYILFLIIALFGIGQFRVLEKKG